MRTSRVILPVALLLVFAACAGGSPSAPDTPTEAPGTASNPNGSSAPATSSPGVVPSTGDGGSATGPPPTAVPGTVTAPGTSTGIEDPTLLPAPGATGALLTLTGVPTAGVEARCWLLEGYLLVGGPAELVGSGQRLTISGRTEPDLMSTCQQGIPLRVESATVA